ncbi:flagellar biosynthetic protein FliP [Hypnocyclicus thermotrophus]|uniref:Flagellar biosynthetic protein FliP n=1 Tax=Hypnocyclicus thermotrophus TaxID=1627895 RepID=A0AA46I571_9FUSO|nr:flagellar type III secretion system pore protein FliP [Hypnocyclicus thermotrophus]TDT68559.1 flagellar biosynthetic protein FliP [Hypnocyclicus thermotrophus]
MRKKISSIFYVLFAISSYAAIEFPQIELKVGSGAGNNNLVASLQILLIMTILTLAPSIIILTTAFVRIIIVLHFIRQALGLQQMPPNQVLVGLALVLTFFIMQPTFNDILENAVNPYLDNKISEQLFFKNIEKPLKTFMLKQTKTEDLELFLKISKSNIPKNREEISIFVVTPAFLISELTRGFEIGILIFIPFIIIDMIVATVLMSLGMMMLPPAMISMPFKLVVFVMVDGWNLILDSLVKSFF